MPFIEARTFLVRENISTYTGILYDRHHTRLINYYSGLTYCMPIFSIIFLFFSLANISIPGSSSFIGEFLIFIGSFQVNIFITVISATSMVVRYRKIAGVLNQ